MKLGTIVICFFSFLVLIFLVGSIRAGSICSIDWRYQGRFMNYCPDGDAVIESVQIINNGPFVNALVGCKVPVVRCE